MANGKYGRAIPRLALAVAEYRERFGEWPTHAHGSRVMIIVEPPGRRSDPDDHVEYRPEIADRVRSRLACEDDPLCTIEVSGPHGRCGYGLVERDDPLTLEAYRWLYDEDPWWVGRPGTPEPPALANPQLPAARPIQRIYPSPPATATSTPKPAPVARMPSARLAAVGAKWIGLLLVNLVIGVFVLGELAQGSGVVREHCLNLPKSLSAERVQIDSKWTFILWPPMNFAALDPPGRCVRNSPLSELLGAAGVWNLPQPETQVGNHLRDQFLEQQGT